jgi:hypothetical protein
MTRPATTTEAPPRRSEREVLAQVIDVLRMFGVDVSRTNTGAAVNPRGQMVRFGTPGDADLSATLPDGRSLRIETKREGFDPAKLRGEKREHFERQLAKLRRVNELGGVGFWTDDSEELARVILPLVLAGARVEEPGYGPLRIIRRNA